MKKIALVLVLSIPFFVQAKIYKGAEYRTTETYTYGRFEVRMKSAERDGMLSSFFTYHENTGTADWNEIDIEIMGRYSDDIQFNPITLGQINHVSHYNAPFNPGLEFHTYAFEWTPTYVAWFVDGEEVHRATGAHIEALNLPQKIMMNVWNPQYPDWAGVWNENILPAFAYYDWVSYSSYTQGTGNTGTDSNFTFQWKDDFNTWDQTRWQKATHTWGGNGCDFVTENAVIKDGMLILCLTKQASVGYTDNTGPNILYARAEPDGIRIRFSEEVDSVSAILLSNYTISGHNVLTASLQPNQKIVQLTTDNYEIGSLSNIVIKNVKDRFAIPNTMATANVTVIKSNPVIFPLKINCAGPAYKTYLADKKWSDTVEYGYMEGTTYTNSIVIGGAVDPDVYKSELNGATKYRVRVPNGSYNIILMMAENYFTSAGKRIFSIAIEGNIVEKDLDIFAKVGKSKEYQTVVSNIQVTDGILDIHFMASVDNALLNGIQILSTPTGTGYNHDKISTPQHWEIGQNYPNPFNGRTIIPVDLLTRDFLSIKFYDTLGRRVSHLEIGDVVQGRYLFTWDARDEAGKPLASGVYYFKVSGNNFSATKKLMLLQ